jgi:hypothetical protein
LTSVAMPCFSGSFKTTTWFHSTPFTFTIPQPPSPCVAPLPHVDDNVVLFAVFVANKNTPLSHEKTTRTSKTNTNYTTLFTNEHQTLITGTWSNTAFSTGLWHPLPPCPVVVSSAAHCQESLSTCPLFCSQSMASDGSEIACSLARDWIGRTTSWERLLVGRCVGPVKP